MRTGKLGWAVMGSVALHVGLAALLWPHSPPPSVSRYPFVIQAKLIPNHQSVVPVSLLEPPPAPSANTAPPPPDVPAGQDAPEAAVNPKPPTPPKPTGYLPIDAVDQAAVPLTDWAIDTEVLPRGYTLRLVLQLWISADGTLDRWEILGDNPNPALAHKALAHLKDTTIQPALLQQTAVPSFRQLEIVVTRD